MDKQTGNCCICGEETKLICNSCAYTWGEFTPTFYCEKHYKTTVLTGNCCSTNEIIYSQINPV